MYCHKRNSAERLPVMIDTRIRRCTNADVDFDADIRLTYAGDRNTNLGIKNDEVGGGAYFCWAELIRL